MNVLYVTDKNYIPIMGTSLASLLVNNKDAEIINIYILEDSIGEEEKEKIKSLVWQYKRSVFFVDVKDIVNKFIEAGVPKYNGQYSTYIRLYAGEVLRKIDKCIYIDCDTLILGKIDELWNKDIKQYPSGAVLDCNHSSANLALRKKKKARYFNAGVMLLNLRYWRENGLFDKFIQASTEIDMNKTLTNSDQELVNYLLEDKTVVIPLKYNVSCYFRIRARSKLMWILNKDKNTFYTSNEIEDAVNNPTILHFTGGSWGRPWFSNSIDTKRDLWESYLRLTPWDDFEKKECPTTLWRKLCILLERKMPIWLFTVIKRVEARLCVWRKCGV